MTSKLTPLDFTVVGIGASAGGIDSFKKFLEAIPEKSGMAFILVQHLSPSHDSILPEILSRATPIPVKEIMDDCEIEPDHIYVIPENKLLKVTDCSLKLLPRDDSMLQMPIDVFFTSLARVHKALAIGVVLSGTARDGTVGLKEIQENGGITFVEDPDLAAWPGMPKSAIDACVVDFMLPAEAIPAKLLQVRSTCTEGDSGDTHKTEPGGNALKKILTLILHENGVDFNHYKKPTLLRRIDRRMVINQISSHGKYLDFLRKNHIERQALFEDLLIKVSSFFRDPEIFEELSGSVLPKLLEGLSDKNPIRIWVAGCATGEEVYSLAITLFELLGGIGESASRNRTKIQFFATDASETAIEKARMGIYRISELESVPASRLNTYFTKADGNYRVIKQVRDTIVFAVHNFLEDPPFSSLDLISCRNVFIYFKPFLQKKALTTFHYALKENGLLLLGKAETPQRPIDLFTPFSKKGNLFSRKSGMGHFSQNLQKQGRHKEQIGALPTTRADYKKSAEAIVISKYSPANVIVDQHTVVVNIAGDIAPFLELPTGKPSHELLKMARKELAFELRNALHKAKASQEAVVKEGIPFIYNGEAFMASLEIVPLTNILLPHYLILFQKKSQNTSESEKSGKTSKSDFASSEINHLQKRNKNLEKELEQVREDVRDITENQEAYNEELQGANEKMQILNEELETSKEEVQSTNEELIVVNRELIEKQDELNDSLNFSDDVIATVHGAFLVLENDFCIRKANAAFFKKFGLDESEVEGKSFFEIQNQQWNDKQLRTLLENLLPEKQRIADEEIKITVGPDDERIYLFNAREIMRKKEDKKLILLAIENITRRKKIETDLKVTNKELTETNDQLDRYVNLASHDLQEPLRKIMIFSDRLMGRGNITDDADKTIVGKIEDAAQRMSGLVKGLLEYSRVAHHGELFEPTDLNRIVDEILIDFELLIEEKGTKIAVDTLPEIEAVPLQMGQLLNNLIGNALKFTKKDDVPEIRITSRPFPNNKTAEFPSLSPELSYTELIVRDNGIGFNPKYQEQIFMIFQRLRQSLEHKGSGIGLSLVKKIVENHHGAIYTVSEEGKGAAFHVILPVEQPR